MPGCLHKPAAGPAIIIQVLARDSLKITAEEPSGRPVSAREAGAGSVPRYSAPSGQRGHVERAEGGVGRSASCIHPAQSGPSGENRRLDNGEDKNAGPKDFGVL